MSRKQPQPADMDSSSEEETEGEEEDEQDENGSSDEDEFDPADDRVNTILAETSNQTQKLKTVDSDVESEYDTESSSESEGLTQKSPKGMTSESTIGAMETSPRMEKKVQNDNFYGKKGMSESDQVVKKGKDEALKQQQKESPPLKIVENEVQPARKGQEGALKQVWKNDDQSQSVKNEKTAGLSAKRRKLDFLQHDGGTDSADSVPIAMKKNNTNAAHDGKMGADKDKPAHILSDSGKEIARKTLNDPIGRANGVKNVVLKVEHEPKQEKKSSMDAAKQPASPQKQKKPHIWSTDEEITMASEVLKHVRVGLEVPSKSSDDFWLTLSEILQEKLGVEFNREQLSKKLKRMKQRYHNTVQRIKECRESQKEYKHKKSSEQKLFEIWSQIWGRAEVTSLEEHEEAASDVKKEQGKPVAVVARPVREGKNDGPSVPKMRSSFTTATTRKASKVDRLTAEPMELDKRGAGQEDHGRDDDRSSPADGSGFLTRDAHKVLHDKIHGTLHELQEWLKRSMAEWMNKSLSLIENTGKTLGDQIRCMKGMGVAGPGLPMRVGNPMELQFVHGEHAFQQQWYELHLQELNIYAQRLELMRKECELKQEQVKLQLQLEREE